MRRVGVHVVRLRGACRPPDRSLSQSVPVASRSAARRSTARLGSAHPHAASARRAALSVSVCVCRRPIRVFHVAVGVLIIIRRAWPGVGHRRQSCAALQYSIRPSFNRLIFTGSHLPSLLRRFKPGLRLICSTNPSYYILFLLF